MTHTKSTPFTGVREMDIIQFVESHGIKLYEYQKVLLKMMSTPKRKAMMSNGASVRRHYGYGKVSKCHYVDERP